MSVPTFKSGDLCGAFRIIRLLGSGRTAEVYEAVRDDAALRVAIRCLRSDHAGDERLARRMIDEAAILARVDQSNVTAYLGGGVHDGVSFAALELVESKSLRERIDRSTSPISIAVALCFARQIADGAGALHAAGAAHGDLRPETIRLTDIDEVKLCDLGPAAPVRSPERAEVRGDIRGVGWIFAEMLAGKQTSAASLAEDLADVPSYARQLVETAVLADPSGAGGFDSMAQLADALNETWDRLIQDGRAGGELRRSLEMLTSVFNEMDKAPLDEVNDSVDDTWDNSRR